MLTIECLLLAGVFTGTVLAAGTGSAPPEALDDEITAPPTMSRDLVQTVRLGEHAARFERTTLAEIRQMLGAGTLEKEGDGADFRQWLCYSLPGQLVWFVSSPMGGSKAALTEVAAEVVEADDLRLNVCPSVPSNFQPVTLEFGWIGNSESSIREFLGKPSSIRGDWLQYHFAGKKSVPYRGPGDTALHEVDFDVTAFVEVRIRDGTAVAVRAFHVTSY